MNANEVIARLAHLAAGLDVHPNDHVNAGQSTNDTFPSAHAHGRHPAVAPGARAGARAPGARPCGAKEAEFADVVKAGRTHLMDAVPVTLGQEFGGYPRQVELGRGPGPAGRRRRRRAARWAARPPAPGSTPRPASPPR